MEGSNFKFTALLRPRFMLCIFTGCNKLMVAVFVTKCKMALKTDIVTLHQCRTCLTEEADMCFLHDNYNIFENINMQLSDVITQCTTIQIHPNDSLPQHLCKRCMNNATTAYQFRVQCEKTDKLLRSNLSMQVKQKTNECHTNKGTSTELENDSSGDISDSSVTKDDSNDCTAHNDFKKFKCITCNIAFTKRKSLNEHLQMHKEHKCIKCSETFVKVTALKKHMKNHIDYSYENRRLMVSAEQRTCDQCGKEFRYRTSMLKHKRKHGAPPKSCPFCNEVPTTPALLAQHMEKEHSQLKKVVCKVCDKAFFKEANLRLHLIMHSGVKRHTCEVCGISFALAGNLAAHKRLHTGEKPYTCSHCGRGFTQQSSLRSHEVGHTNKRDHVCPDCGAAFSRPGALRNHRKRHLPNRPFVCSMCGKAFTFSSERKRHMTIHSGIKNHVCDVCGRRFNRNTNLKVHMRIHTGETPHVCQTCGKGFIQAHCLRTHMNTHKEGDCSL